MYKFLQQFGVRMDMANNDKSDNIDDKSVWYSGNISATSRKPQPKTPSELSEFLFHLMPDSMIRHKN